MKINGPSLRIPVILQRFTRGALILRKLLIKPSEAVAESGDRRTAELISALTLFFAVLNMAGAIAAIADGSPNPAGLILLFVLAGVTFTGYFLSRTRFFRLSGIIILGIWTLASQAYVFSGRTTDGPSFAILNLIPFGFILGYVLLDFQYLVIMVVINLAGVALLPIFDPDASGRVFHTAAGVLFAMGGLSLITQWHRNQIERERLMVISDVNRDLRQRETIMEAVTITAEEFLTVSDWRLKIDSVLQRLGMTIHATHAYVFEDHINAQGEPVTSMRYEWTAPGFTSDLDNPVFQSSIIRQKGYEDQVAALSRGQARIGNSSTFTPIEKEDMDSLGVKAILEIPVFINDRQWGAIGFDDFEAAREWSSIEIDALKIVAGILGATIKRQESESALQNSERIYRQAIEAAGAVPYYQLYNDDKYQFIGRGIEKITGYLPEEMSFSLWNSILQEQEMAGSLAGMDPVEAARRVRSGEIDHWKSDVRILARDGQMKWIADSAIELFDESGTSYASIGIMQDITERKQNEANLRQRESMLEAVTFAAEQFLKAADWRLNINEVLKRLGETIDATHVFIFEHQISAERVEQALLKHEWTASGYPSSLDDPYYQKPQPLDEEEESPNILLRRGEIYIGDSSTFVPSDRERYGTMGLKSIVELPVFVDGKWWGTFGVDDYQHERKWSNTELDALKVATGILSAAIQRQETEAAVRESEQIYRQAIEAAGAVPYYRDYRENHYSFMGKEIERMIGYKPEEVTFDLWFEIMKENIPLGEGEGLHIDDAVKHSRTGKLKVWRSDMRVVARDGEEKWITDSAVELFDESELSYASVGILQDVTDRKKTEANLRKRESVLEATTFAAERFLRSLDWRGGIDAVLERLGMEFNASHAYLFEKHPDADGRIVNSMRYEWTAPGQKSDLDDSAYQNAPGNEPEYDHYYNILDSGEPFVAGSAYFREEEKAWMDATGIKALLEMRVIVDGRHWGTLGIDQMVTEREWTPMEVDVIRVATSVLGAAIKRQLDESALQKELDERKRLIEELKVKHAESETLRESVAIVAATLERSDAINLILEQLERVVHFNSASVQLLNEDTLEIVSTRGADLVQGMIGMQFPLNENEPAYPVVQGVVPYLLYKDVQLFVPAFSEGPHNQIHAWLAVPLKVKGRIIGIIALDGLQTDQFSERDAELAVTYANQVAIALENARLFSELQEKFDEHQKLVAELERKNSELERFTYTVSHDLKSPLVTINGFLGYLEQDAVSGNLNRLKHDMQRISDAVRKMQSLLDELLELSRIGRVVNPPERAPFVDLVKESLYLVAGRLDTKQVVVDIQTDLPDVFVDKPRVVEVLQNLLDNAAKYMGEQPQPRIEIGEKGEEDGLPIFFIRDNGMGIDPQYHDRVFGLFDKLDSRSEGTGVGLALVKRIIELHGGRIWVESQLGQGSTFCFTLPQAVL